ncbi:MAG: cellulase family glycosylhydrolase [Candidatus Lokiarchaeota archaeon]|nr:cellulase family glycosylhydrolase [Candidatus Lokiarchaeota archaeon]MBD3342257.1 cellulase family glycosylhydrolase [Candidatus Lokiarchaeota archaeon]
MRLKVNNKWLVDKYGRIVLLRGVNLGGSSKVPTEPNGATHIKTDFRDHRNVSFVGRPFPLKEAEGHFRRIKHWGFNCLRFLVTWEAIEHQGPNQYDNEYLDYICEVLKIAEPYDFYIFIDPHQDVWSRMTGGDGAPGWLFEKLGLDFTKFDKSEAAYIMQYRYDPNNSDAYPPMTWDNNNVRFANATMWTLFFGGKDFAPSFNIDGKNIQDYLQGHYMGAMEKVAKRVKDNSSIIGFDTLNEPKKGWIEDKVDGTGQGLTEIIGHAFTPFEAMKLAAGYPVTVPYRKLKGTSIKETRQDTLNPQGISCWLEGAKEIWKSEDIWGLDEHENPIILNNDHFTTVNGKKVDFYKDYLTPFIMKFSTRIKNIIPNAIFFFEGPELNVMMGKKANFAMPANEIPFIHAPHWYDIGSLITKRAMIRANYDVMTEKIIFGKKNVQKMFNRQLAKIKSTSEQIAGGIPTLIGEFGIHCDLNNKKAYKNYPKKGQRAFKKSMRALNMYYNALDANLLHATQWNYTSDNTNEWGDLWNLEDLSIFSKDQQDDPNNINSGGRAIKGFCRPHFLYCAGIPYKMEFDLESKDFLFEFDGDSTIEAPTVIYVPKYQYPEGYDVEISEGELKMQRTEQTLSLYIKQDGIHQINISAH